MPPGVLYFRSAVRSEADPFTSEEISAFPILLQYLGPRARSWLEGFHDTHAGAVRERLQWEWRDAMNNAMM